MNHHDASYKNFFRHPEMVETMLTGFVKEDFVSELDYSTLEHCAGSYITDDLRERMDDCVWKVKWRGRTSYICLLLEFQSTSDPWMPVRIMTYTGLLWQDLIKTGQLVPGDALPPVLPIVIYNGAAPWKSCLTVEEMCQRVPAGLEPYRSGRKYILLDEKHCGTQADEDNLFSFLVRFENAKKYEEFRAILKALRQRLKAPKYRELRRLFSLWLVQVVFRNISSSESNMAQNMPEVHDLEEVENMLEENVASWKDQWWAAGREAGREEGREAGREEGRAEEKLATLANNISALMDSLKVTRDKAMDLLKISAEDREKLASAQ